MPEISFINLEEFEREGFMQEANRTFFHPLGLSLAIVDLPDGQRVFGVLDGRMDPEGFWFDFRNTDEHLSFVRRVANVGRWINARREARERLLGYWVQPSTLPDQKDSGIILP